MASDSSSTLIKLTPSSTLTFQLERGAQPKTVLKVANITASKILFKVKTTQPTWYYVRPNQQILAPGQVEDVAILMVEAECNRYLEQVAQHTEEKLDKHRFLVQSRVIEDSDYNRIISLPTSQRSDEFSKLWDGPKDDRKSVKLKVEFTYPDSPGPFSDPGSASTARRAPSTVSENVENVRSRLSAGAGENTTTTPGRTAASDEGIAHSGSANPDAIFGELQGLRKKYDAVVEYTVHLTAERDAIVSQLEAAQRELTKEKNRKKGDTGAAVAGSGKSDKAADKKVVEKGFSLFVVLIAALICFLFGKYMS